MPNPFRTIASVEIQDQRKDAIASALMWWNRGGPGHRSAIYLLIAIAIGAAVGAFPLLTNRYAYFGDDMQAYFMPTLYAIGHTLRQAGYIPFLTTQNWYGGNLYAEYQYALLNPIALGLYALLPTFKSLAGGAAFLAIAYYSVLAGGIFVLARTVGISRRYAYVAVTAVATNSFLFYWYAASWFPGFSSIAFMVWAMAFILRADTGGGPFVAAAVMVYLTVTAGFPTSVVALAAVIAVWIVVLVAQGRWRCSMAAAVAGGLGFVSASPSMVPLLSVRSVMARPSYLGNGGGYLTPNLGDVLAVTNPFHHGFMLTWAGYVELNDPMFYAGWFVVPLLVFLEWRNVSWNKPETVWLLSLCALFLMATQGPAHISIMQGPFKFMPYFQICLIITVLYFLSEAGFAAPSRNRILLMIAVMTITTLQSLQVDPLKFASIAGPALIIAVISVGVVVLAPRHGASAALIMILTTAGVAVYVRTVVPRNFDLTDWGFRRLPEHVRSLWQVPNSWTFFVVSAPSLPRDPSFYDDLVFGQMGLAVGVPTVNGYSPLMHKGLMTRFCWGAGRFVCPEAGLALLQVDPTTQMTYADLMRVDRVVVQKGNALTELQKVVREPWRLLETRTHAVIYGHPLPNRQLPGTLSWPVHGINAEAVGKVSATRERLEIKQRDDQVRMLIFARAFWPGYRATLDGSPLPVHAHAGFLLSVDLPPGHRGGKFELWYRPVLFYSAVAASVGALLLVFLGAGLGYPKYAAWRTQKGE